MEQNFEYLKNLALAQLMKSPIGDKLHQGVQIIQTIQHNYYALAEGDTDLKTSSIRVITTLTFAILRKIGEGKTISAFSTQDWKEIASTVSQYAILDVQKYSVFVFFMYERYIRSSVEQIEEHIPAETANILYGLADELSCKTSDLNDNEISEASYIEDCLWISLEAMLKLLACTAVLFGDDRITDYAQAIAAYSFEYGRLMLRRRELEIITQYMESQYQLDTELEQRYAVFLDDLQIECQQFRTLVDNAFAPNYREAFLHSIRLAKYVGLNEDDILCSSESIDSYFLN